MPLLDHLWEQLQWASAGLPAVSELKMFGCNALFARGHIFGLIWKDGRIALKLTDPADYAALHGLPGTQPWTGKSPRAQRAPAKPKAKSRP